MVEFTPYTSLAGHHLYDYTYLPIQFLPRRWVHRTIRRIAIRSAIDPAGPIAAFDALNGLTIRAFHAMREQAGLVLGWEDYRLRTFWFEADVRFLRRWRRSSARGAESSAAERWSCPAPPR